MIFSPIRKATSIRLFPIRELFGVTHNMLTHAHNRRFFTDSTCTYQNILGTHHNPFASQYCTFGSESESTRENFNHLRRKKSPKVYKSFSEKALFGETQTHSRKYFLALQTAFSFFFWNTQTHFRKSGKIIYKTHVWISHNFYSNTTQHIYVTSLQI